MIRGSWLVWLVVCGSWFVVRGSWLVARGSWLVFVARGSWFVVRGSWFVVRGSCGSRLVGAVLEGGPRESCVKRYSL